MARRLKPPRSRNCQDRTECPHEEGRPEVCWRIISHHDVSNPNQRVTQLRNDPGCDHEGRVPRYVCGRNQKCGRHRQVEDASDLYLPYVKGRPWGKDAEEPAREDRSSGPKCEMSDATNRK